ncbi:hypothetical protein [Nocardiopsis valliformis]|uniref:hypothetical protein n=1 Tax=Nocardiopsis valliformis TaxID=239974 RepID=UPI0003483303|nr:hypothetical protein [Nocardiopsis valliformis]
MDQARAALGFAARRSAHPRGPRHAPGSSLFVSDAQEALRASHRESFFAEMVDPMVARAKVLEVPIAQVVARIRQLDEGDRT